MLGTNVVFRGATWCAVRTNVSHDASMANYDASRRVTFIGSMKRFELLHCASDTLLSTNVQRPFNKSYKLH
jgi:hypothetical protein